MTSTAKQPKVLKTHETASQKAGTTIYIDNMSQTPTPCRTIPPPKTKTNTSHSTRQPASGTHQFSSHLHPTCCMHVHQQQSQTCKPGHFTRDPCKLYLKSDLQPTIHASPKQEKPLQVNTEKVNTHWVHSYRMEHAEHFPAPMEMCMDDHHTQTTERTQ